MKAEALKSDVDRDVEVKAKYLEHLLNWEVCSIINKENITVTIITII